MQSVYVVFLASNFKTGKLIRTLTNSKYNHVAISLTPKIKELYSYARYNLYKPLLGGFGVEYANRYLFQNQDVAIKICQVQVTDEHYQEILTTLDCFKENQDKTKYNFLSVIAYPFGKNVKIRYTYTCLEFVLKLLHQRKNLSIKGFEKLLMNAVIYEGGMRDCLEEGALKLEDRFFDSKKRVHVYRKTAVYFCALCYTAMRELI